MTNFFCSVFETSVGFRSLRLRFRDFEERIWLRNALCLLNLPLAVRLNRFFAPESDFILGICHSASFVGSFGFDGFFFFPVLS
jgi:hypothetical protein